ncbi:MAG: adenylate kinase family protein [Halobacteriaceae archaeon]
MRVAVTGTPGTGKSTATDLLDTDLPVVHLNDLIREEDLYESVDEERDSLVADLDAVAERIPDDAIVESHLAHRLDADRVVVLRCHPEEIERRLEERGEPPETVAENAESEALDVILAAAVERHGRENVYEVETTDRPPEAVARDIEAVVAGEREPSAGTVDYTGYL